MEIKVEKARRMKVADFADQHGLTMKCVERTRTDLHPSFNYEAMHWYAYFENTDIKDGSMLCGSHRNGPTQAAAIKAYAQEISGKLLVVGAFTPERREIWVPELY